MRNLFITLGLAVGLFSCSTDADLKKENEELRRQMELYRALAEENAEKSLKAQEAAEMAQQMAEEAAAMARAAQEEAEKQRLYAMKALEDCKGK